jgi:hypothetical protein
MKVMIKALVSIGVKAKTIETMNEIVKSKNITQVDKNTLLLLAVSNSNPFLLNNKNAQEANNRTVIIQSTASNISFCQSAIFPHCPHSYTITATINETIEEIIPIVTAYICLRIIIILIVAGIGVLTVVFLLIYYIIIGFILLMG